ncbi:hypothetical protein LSH36_398g02029 [Paralvinella palmiformis]|uniref:Carbohydrate sulfotransferase n=1 Tax=Paralvinella palmiformis TaxID=53620 RepID=A0AAD9JDI1_9ANNE|nr:hypothetical protein LSH36_398g02029 [Paralvinella palmiformis]
MESNLEPELLCGDVQITRLPECPNSVPFRPSLRLLKRHSRRVVVVVLCLQVAYILINITERSGYNKTFLSHLPSEMYTFRRRFKDESIREPLGRKVLRSPENILYEEDYDYLGEPIAFPSNRNPSPKADPEWVQINPTPLPTKLERIHLAALFPEADSDRRTPLRRRRQIASCTMDERSEHIKGYCNTTDTGDEPTTENGSGRYGTLLVDEKHKVIFCDVHDSISLLWASFIAKTTGNANLQRPPVRNRNYMTKIGLNYLDSYSGADREAVLRESFKFLVVRHPMERMALVWKAKFVDNSPDDLWRKKLAKRILDSLRSESGKEARLEDDDVTVSFDQFLRFAFVERNLNDPIWLSYLKVCHPCEIRYDAILHAESMASELGVVLRRYDDVPRRRYRLNYKPTEHLLVDVAAGSYHLSVYDNVTSEAVEALLKKYKHDMKMFGYTWNGKKKTTVCGIIANNGRICC